MAAKVDDLETKMAWAKNKSVGGENISSLWTDFTQDTGFHGVNKLTVGRNYKFRCFWWTIAVVGMLAYMSYNITKEIMNYYRYPTVSSMKVELVEELSFPAVTICNQSPYNMTKVTAFDPELPSFLDRVSILGLLLGTTIDWNTQYLGRTFREPISLDWWKNMFMDPEQMFYHCFMLGTSMSCSKIMKPVVTKYGLCGTFNYNVSDVTSVRITGSDKNLIVLAGINQDVYVPGSFLSAGFRVILHEPHVHPDAAISSFLTGPGTTTYAVLKKTTFKYLPHPFKAFANSRCIDTTAPDFNNTLKFYDIYTYEHCFLECQIRKLYQICGCAKAQDDESLGQKCSMYDFITCYIPTLVALDQNVEFKKSCGCQVPCSFQTYEAKVSTSKYPSNVFENLIMQLGFDIPDKTYLRDNMLEIRIYYENLLVQSVEQVAQYSTETIIGNLGGHMGICLGASILTLTELGEFLIVVILTLVRRVTHKRAVQNSNIN